MNRSSRFALLAALSLASFSATVASAQQSVPINGTWSGVLTSSTKIVVAVDAQFDAAGVSLHFDEPYNCRIAASLLVTEGDATRYRFKPSTNGGDFCTRLYPGELVATLGAKQVSLSISMKNATTWTGNLSGPATSP
jgi:hypothetical protein